MLSEHEQYILEQQESIYKRAVDKWGTISQIEMTLEECIELCLAIQHLKRERIELMPLLEEIADVEIMCGQMRKIFDPELIDRVKVTKLERLVGRLNK